MNLLLVEQVQDSYWISGEDPRSESILRLSGGEVCLGVVGGSRGIGSFQAEEDGGVRIERVQWEDEVLAPPPIDLIAGLPRPAEARRILVQATAMGVQRVTFAVLERTPAGYAESRSLSSDSVDRLVREGLEQGFHTARPEVRFVVGLEEALASADADRPISVLDPYLGECLLGEGREGPDFPGTVFLGSERGFSPDEQKVLRRSSVRLRHLGSSILRTETAVVAALALAHRQSGQSLSSSRSIIGGRG